MILQKFPSNKVTTSFVLNSLTKAVFAKESYSTMILERESTWQRNLDTRLQAESEKKYSNIVVAMALYSASSDGNYTWSSYILKDQ